MSTIMNKAGSKSPLKEPLLRLPGQSIDEQIHQEKKASDFLPCQRLIRIIS
jgi:hypothetical protein